jgi:hypothetical protein
MVGNSPFGQALWHINTRVYRAIPSARFSSVQFHNSPINQYVSSIGTKKYSEPKLRKNSLNLEITSNSIFSWVEFRKF